MASAPVWSGAPRPREKDRPDSDGACAVNVVDRVVTDHDGFVRGDLQPTEHFDERFARRFAAGGVLAGVDHVIDERLEPEHPDLAGLHGGIAVGQERSPPTAITKSTERPPGRRA